MKANLGLPVLLLVSVVAGATLAEAQTKTYVVHSGANIVSVLDTATGTVAGTIPVDSPARVAVTRDGTRAYVTNGASSSVSVIDTAADAITATIAVGDRPSAVAVTPDGNFLYVMTGSGVIDVVDTALRTVVASISIGSTGDIAISPDGSRAYVAAGLVYIIDTVTNTVVRSFVPETASISGIANNASSVVFSPDGSRAYVGVYTFDTTVNAGFSAGGSVVLIDTASESITGAINLFALPGLIALTTDGSRAYVTIQSIFVNTGYGMGFLPAGWVEVIDTMTNSLAGIVDLGNLNTPAGIGVTADRRAVYIAVPRLAGVAVADVNTNAVSTVIPLTSSGDLAVVPDATVATVAYVLHAADDSGTATSVGATAVANVLANDTIGGIRVTTAHVALSQQSSTSGGVSLNPATGAVTVAAGTAIGTYALVYRMCEIAAPSNCAEATVTVTVLAPFVIDAVNDSAVTMPDRTVIASVLANDTLGETPATTSRVRLSVVSSTSAGITLDLATGSVYVALGTLPGTQTLTYRICEIADPSNCDDADVTITVNAFPIDAVNDAGWALRTGGTAVANVLANDRFAAATATLAKVRLSQVASTDAGVSLNVATGAVTVAPGTTVGTQTLRYAICEIATPPNCGEAIVTVTVSHLPLSAMNDLARGSSKIANTPLASVLANDRLNGALATTANVKLSFVSLTPVNTMIRLDLTDGSVDVLGKTSSGTYSLVYEICELAMPSNYGRATVTLDLSGR